MLEGVGYRKQEPVVTQAPVLTETKPKKKKSKIKGTITDIMSNMPD